MVKGDSTRCAALASSVAFRLGALSLDELRVVDVVISRMLGVGRDTHGPLDLARERRDWTKEGADELADAIFYVACKVVAANDARLERLRCEAADEQVAGFLGVDVGLAELRDNPPIAKAHAFDVTDLDDAGGEA